MLSLVAALHTVLSRLLLLQGAPHISYEKQKSALEKLASHDGVASEDSTTASNSNRALNHECDGNLVFASRLVL